MPMKVIDKRRQGKTTKPFNEIPTGHYFQDRDNIIHKKTNSHTSSGRIGNTETWIEYNWNMSTINEPVSHLEVELHIIGEKP